jgi:hypothetical protein
MPPRAMPASSRRCTAMRWTVPWCPGPHRPRPGGDEAEDVARVPGPVRPLDPHPRCSPPGAPDAARQPERRRRLRGRAAGPRRPDRSSSCRASARSASASAAAASVPHRRR